MKEKIIKAKIKQQDGSFKETYTDSNKLKKSEIKHKNLPLELELRLQKIWKTIKEYDLAKNYKVFNEDFRRDENPEMEIVLWERFVEIFMKCINECNANSFAEKNKVYKYLIFRFIIKKFNISKCVFM